MAEVPTPEEIEIDNNRETRNLMDHAADEITMLRNRVEILQPKADAYDLMTKIFDLVPEQRMGASVDIVWQLRQYIDRLQPTKPEPGK